MEKIFKTWVEIAIILVVVGFSTNCVNAEMQINFLNEIPNSCTTNEQGKFGMHLGENAIKTDSQDRIIVADGWNHRIQIFDKNGTFIKTFGCSGVAPGKFAQPNAIAVDHNNRILVADKWDRIQIFDKDGNLVDISGGTDIPWIEGNGAPCYIASLEVMMKGGSYGPEFRFIAVDSNNRIIAIHYDMCNNDKYTIRIYNSDGALVKEFGDIETSDPTSSSEIYANLAVDSNNQIIVAYSKFFPSSGTSIQEVRIYNSSGNFIKKVANVNGFAALNSQDYLVVKKVNYGKIEGFDVYDLNGTHIKTISGDVTSSGFYYPSMTIDSQNRIIIEESNGTIKIFDDDGKFITSFGGRGDVTGHLNMPFGVAVDHLNRTIVADTQNQDVQIFNPDGTYNKTVRRFFNLTSSECPLSPVALCDPLRYTLDVAVDSNNRINVVDDLIYGRITVLNSNGSFINAFGNSNNADDKLYSPGSVDVDSHDRIIVADSYYFRIRIFDSNLNPITTFGSEGRDNGKFNVSFGVSVDEDDRIIVADTLNNRIQIFDKNGNFTKTFGNYGTGNGQFNWPWGVAAYKDIIAVSDFNNARIQIFDRNGTFIKSFGEIGFEHSQFITPTGLDFDDYGRLYVTDTGNYRIQSFELKNYAKNGWNCSKDSECESNYCYYKICKPAGYCDKDTACGFNQNCNLAVHQCQNITCNTPKITWYHKCVNCSMPFDLDNDTKVDIFDVVAGLEFLSGSRSEIFNWECSDVNDNGIDLIDLFTLITKIVNE